MVKFTFYWSINTTITSGDSQYKKTKNRSNSAMKWTTVSLSFLEVWDKCLKVRLCPFNTAGLEKCFKTHLPSGPSDSKLFLPKSCSCLPKHFSQGCSKSLNSCVLFSPQKFFKADCMSKRIINAYLDSIISAIYEFATVITYKNMDQKTS